MNHLPPSARGALTSFVWPLVAFATTELFAPAVAHAEPGRPWREVMADVIDALGGRDRLSKHVSLHEKVKVSLVAQNMAGVVETWATREGKALRITNIATMPEIREGTDGKIYWSQDAINGLRVLTGVEKEQARLETAWMPELRLNAFFSRIESARETGEHGEAVECLTLVGRATAKDAVAPTLTNCYDEKTHLQVSQRGRHASAEGDVPFSTTFSDYRDVDGIKLPFSCTTTAGPVTFTAETQQAVWDEPTKGLPFGLPKPKKDVAPPSNAPSGSTP